MISENLKKKKRRGEVKNLETDDPPYLPHEVILEKILNRVPVLTLIRCGCVCKLWHHSIHHDQHFASSHFLQSQQNPYLIFNFLNVKDDHRKLFFNHYFFRLSEDKTEEEDDDGVDLILRKQAYLSNSQRDLVGYCNGLFCLTVMDNRPGIVEIFNPSRLEVLWIFRPIFDGCIICYGFGFDSLTKEYKVVLILFMGDDEFKCLVFTLGTNSWRETTSIPSTRQIFSTTNCFKSAAVFCGSALFWRRTRHPNQMMLSFDLHDETFQVIQLPDECVSTATTKIEEQKLVRLLDFKGSPCVARIEKTTLPATDHEDQNNSSSSCCKVHLHILKDKVKQVWIKETFDLLSSLLPPCFYNATTPTRIMSFSGRVLLYWFNMKQLQFYDLHMKHLKVVKPSPDDYYQIFGKKRRSASSDYKIRVLDYQLNSHIENLLSLQTFLPAEGAHRIKVDALQDMLKQAGPRSPGGLLCLHRKSREYYVFN